MYRYKYFQSQVTETDRHYYILLYKKVKGTFFLGNLMTSMHLNLLEFTCKVFITGLYFMCTHLYWTLHELDEKLISCNVIICVSDCGKKFY